MNKWMYEVIYRFASADLIFGPTSKIEAFVDLAIDGRIPPGKAITLGCGVGRESIYLAKRGFEVTGLDFSPTAIQKARQQAELAGVDLRFIEDDLTKLKHQFEPFNLVMDFGALNDLNQEGRDLYMSNVLPLTQSGSFYVMFCFDKKLPSEEVTRRFGDQFEIEVINQGPDNRYTGTLTLYSMIKK